MDTFLQDVRYAMRSFVKSPGFFAIVVLSLALGIGANSTIFSVVNALIYRSLPYHDPDRLTVIWATEPGHPDSRNAPPIAELVDWKARNNVFDDIALTSGTEPNTLSGIGQPESVAVQYATPNFFGLLGVQPALGRVPRHDEIQDEFQTIVISDAFWKRSLITTQTSLENQSTSSVSFRSSLE